WHLDGFLLLNNINYGQHKGYIAAHSGTWAFYNKYFIGSLDDMFYGKSYYNYKGPGTLKVCSVPPLSPPSLSPVGGEAYSINKLAILAPYIAFVGLALIIALVVKKRKY
ncbi:MAG: hypothetical protein QXE19_02570, partial [Candidatus Bathyarchaeia archaeon]